MISNYARYEGQGNRHCGTGNYIAGLSVTATTVVMADPAGTPAGCVVKTSLAAVPGVISKASLVAEVRLPLVAISLVARSSQIDVKIFKRSIHHSVDSLSSRRIV